MLLEILKAPFLWALRKLLKNPTGSFALIGRLLREQGPRHWRGYVFAFLCMAAMASSTAASAWVMKDVIDKVFIAKNMTALWQIAAFLTVPSRMIT